MADDQSILAYDLRQKYAEIVGFHLELVAKARLDKDLPGYYDALINLVVVIKHKFKKKKKSYGDETKEENEKKEKQKTQEEQYQALLKIAIDSINLNPGVYTGTSKDDKAYSEILNNLSSIEMFLYFVMEKSGMFGSISSNRGL